MEQSKFDRAIQIVTLLIAVMGVIHVAWMIYQGRGIKVTFEIMQYVAMLLVMVPGLLRKRLNLEMPWWLYSLIVFFCFWGLIMGDALNFYKIVPYWDDMLHLGSGVLLAAIGLWLLRVGLAKNDKPISFNRWALLFYLIVFSLGCATLWECIEFMLDGYFGINMQQFMATTTGSLVTDADIPNCGREALYDTMIDLSDTLVGAVPTAIYCFFRYDKIITK